MSSNIVQTTKGPNFIYVIIDNLLPPDTCKEPSVASNLHTNIGSKGVGM